MTTTLIYADEIEVDDVIVMVTGYTPEPVTSSLVVQRIRKDDQGRVSAIARNVETLELVHIDRVALDTLRIEERKLS